MHSIIRAIPKWGPQGEQYFDVSNLPWGKVSDFREELDQQGFYVQDLLLAEPMHVLVSREIRMKIEEEKAKERVPSE